MKETEEEYAERLEKENMELQLKIDKLEKDIANYKDPSWNPTDNT